MTKQLARAWPAEALGSTLRQKLAHALQLRKVARAYGTHRRAGTIRTSSPKWAAGWSANALVLEVAHSPNGVRALWTQVGNRIATSQETGFSFHPGVHVA